MAYGQRTIDIRIKNLPQIKAAFAKSPRLMAKNVNIAIKSALITVERQSRINTPVDTGYLRASHRSTFENLKGTIEPKANYAYWVHEGTKFMPARPFLERAIESEDSKTQRFFTLAVQNTLNEIGKST